MRMPSSSRCWLNVLCAALSLFLASCEPGKVVTLFQIYPARQAAFGASVPDYGWLNLMLPPRNQSNLCEYPKMALEVNDTKRDLPQNVMDVNIAILVRSGNCSAERQARNAAKLKNQGGVSRLKYLIIEGEFDDGNLLGVLFPDSNDTADIASIGVLSTTYRAGVYLREDIKTFHQDSQLLKSPYLFDEESVYWDMIGNIDPYWFNNDDSPTDNFYWFRILLFTLLIVSPCIRAAYLWWAGGGRFRLRRNDQGRITGIEYIRPMPHWLSSGMIPGARPTGAPTADTLTEEEFNALPEIEYKERDDTEAHDEEDGEADVEVGEASQRPADMNTSVAQSGSVSVHVNHVQPSIVGANSAAPVSESLEQSPVLESTCTMCSICIDDFEAGETLVLLPRCRHSFHRDCIHPWLTERQGCCPLCKTGVLEKDEGRAMRSAAETSSSNDDDTSSDTSPPFLRDDPSTVALSTTTGELDDSEESLPAVDDVRRRQESADRNSTS